MTSLVSDYSGIVFNQNQRPATSGDLIDITDGAWRYQEFFLPDNYVRGADISEQLTPPLTGTQLCVSVDDSDVALDWKVEYDIFGIGWITVASGTTSGLHAAGDQVWMDLLFDEPVDVTAEMISSRFRLGFQVPDGQTNDFDVWFSNPNPLATRFAKARAADGFTAIQSGGADISFLFRVLGLTADEGVDYLGNSYRSAVRASQAQAVNTVTGSENTIWLSKPNPSRFAVESLYFDVRPIKEHPTYVLANLIRDPSGEPGGSTWVNASSYRVNPCVSFNRTTAQSHDGNSSLQIVTNSSSSSQGIDYQTLQLVGNQSYWVSGWALGSVGGESVRLIIGDATVGTAGADLALSSTTWQRFSFKFTPSVTSTTGIAIRTSSAQVATFFLDSVMVVADHGELTAPDYVDGDKPGYTWSGAPHASTTVKVIDPDIQDSEAVIDSVLVDPITPNVYFSVYYSSEGDAASTEEDWEWKLWDRVPQTFKATKRETHVLPEPIRAKYIKIEFTHLQADHYAPGQFAQPTRYKKHPKWVLDYFLARLNSERDTDNLLTGRVAVVYDALDLAYNYYLDDINQAPNVPYEKDPDYQSTSTFLDQRTDVSDQVDPIMLNKINLSLTPYKEHISVFANTDSLLGQQVQFEATLNFGDQPVEKVSGTADQADLRELRNEAVVFENDYPVMFYYLTCRHRYREVVANFENDKGYFVGIREVSFQRERYATSFDSDQYIEPAGDLLNTERNDFTMQNGTMVIV
jgi:hypothetical protein